MIANTEDDKTCGLGILTKQTKQNGKGRGGAGQLDGLGTAGAGRAVSLSEPQFHLQPVCSGQVGRVGVCDSAKAPIS